MNNQTRPRRQWHGAAGAALLATIATMAGSFAATAAPASATAAPSTPVTTVPVTTADMSASAKLAEIQVLAAKEIANRVTSLGTAISNVEKLTYLGSDQATMVNDMQADISGLQALGAKIAADTTVAQARSDRSQLFTQYRVYWLVLPVVSLVSRTDHALNVETPALNTEITTLQGKVTSVDTRAERLITDAQDLVAKAGTATSGLSVELLGYTASQWDANNRLLSTPRGAVRSAERYLFDAKFDLAKANFFINHHRGGPIPAPVSPTTTTTAA